MNGKGIFIWKAVNTGMTDLGQITQALLDLGLSWVAVKIGDAASTRFASFGNSQAAAVRVLKESGLKVWGWHYIYGGIGMVGSKITSTNGASPSAEAAFAKGEVKRLGLDGYIIDAEKEYKVYEAYRRAGEFVNALRGIGVPVGLASYRFPTLHTQFPWDQFVKIADVHMPQLYWGPGKPVIDLERSIRELLAIRGLPVCPIGRAYIGDGHSNPTVQEINAFMSRAKELKLPGISFWALDFLYLHAGGELRAEMISAFDWKPAPTWAESITKWARALGYQGPGPE